MNTAMEQTTTKTLITRPIRSPIAILIRSPISCPRKRNLCATTKISQVEKAMEKPISR